MAKHVSQQKQTFDRIYVKGSWGRATFLEPDDSRVNPLQ